MSITDYYSKAWAEVSKNLVAWVVLYTAFIAVTVFTCGLGAILLPNVFREVRDALAEGRAPGMGGLFRTDRLGNDVFNLVILYGAMAVGSMLAGLGAPVAGVLLQMVTPLAADDRYAPLDNAKISFKHVLAHLGDHVVFFLIANVLIWVSAALCGLPLLVAMPVIGVAQWLWYNDVRAELDGIAESEGVRLIQS